MAAVSLLTDLVVFLAFTFGVGAAVAPVAVGNPVLRLTLGIGLALVGEFVVAFGGFAGGLSNNASAAAVAAGAVIVAVLRRDRVRANLAAPEVRAVLTAWAIFAVWNTGLLALVRSYSGGGWVVDWVEHWQRTQFFLERQSPDTVFGGQYGLTARPPLANLLIAGWLAGRTASYAHFQWLVALFGSLVLLPAWLIAQQWSPRALSRRTFLLVFLLSPLVCQNLAFSWTKLPAAFFVLTTVAAWIGTEPRTRSLAIASAVCLAGGVLTHYSAAPWVVGLTIAWLVVNRRRTWIILRDSAGWSPVIGFVAPLALWVGWAAWRFGWHGTLANNTTAAGWQTQTVAGRVATLAGNVFDTIVPFPLRGGLDYGIIAQASALGRVRDLAFSLYQLNLLFSVGLAGLWVLVLSVSSWRRSWRPRLDTATSALVTVTLPLVVVMGSAVVTQRDHWGLVHICLQPVAIVGLAWVAAALPGLSVRAWRLWLLFAVVDAAFGIALHFALESPFVRPLLGADSEPQAYARLSPSALTNAVAKRALHLDFFADHLSPSMAGVLLAAALAAALASARSPAVDGVSVPGAPDG